MQSWLPIVVALCLIAVTAALVPMLLALRRVAERAERVLAVVESDLRPTIARAQALLDEMQGLSRDVRGEVERVGVLTRRVSDLAEGTGRVMTSLAGFTKVGQFVSLVAGVKTGVNVFLRRLRRR